MFVRRRAWLHGNAVQLHVIQPVGVLREEVGEHGHRLFGQVPLEIDLHVPALGIERDLVLVDRKSTGHLAHPFHRRVHDAGHTALYAETETVPLPVLHAELVRVPQVVLRALAGVGQHHLQCTIVHVGVIACDDGIRGPTTPAVRVRIEVAVEHEVATKLAGGAMQGRTQGTSCAAGLFIAFRLPTLQRVDLRVTRSQVPVADAHLVVRVEELVVGERPEVDVPLQVVVLDLHAQLVRSQGVQLVARIDRVVRCLVERRGSTRSVVVGEVGYVKLYTVIEQDIVLHLVVDGDHGVVHLDADGTVAHGVALHDAVLDHGVAEVDAGQDLAVDRIVGCCALDVADGIADHVILDHHAIAIVPIDAATVVHGSAEVGDHVALHGAGLPHEDPRVAGVVHAVVADVIGATANTDTVVSETGLTQARDQRDVGDGVTRDGGAVVDHRDRRSVGVLDRVPRIGVVVPVALDAVVALLEGTAAHRVVRSGHINAGHALAFEGDVLHLHTGTHPVDGNAVVMDGSFHRKTAGVGAVGCPEVERTGSGIVKPLAGSVQFAELVAQEEAPVVVARAVREGWIAQCRSAVAADRAVLVAPVRAADHQSGVVPVAVRLGNSRTGQLPVGRSVNAQPAGVGVARQRLQCAVHEDILHGLRHRSLVDAPGMLGPVRYRRCSTDHWQSTRAVRADGDVGRART